MSDKKTPKSAIKRDKPAKRTHYSIKLSLAEWGALCVCANHGANEIMLKKPRGRPSAAEEATKASLLEYADGAIRVIRSVLPMQGDDT